MYNRFLYPALKKHLSRKQITVITGMRRVGKSTAIKYLLGEIPHSNKIYIDLEKIEWRNIFLNKGYDEIQEILELEGIIFNLPCVIAIDEIQLVPSITSLIKYFYDTYKLKFIISGSSSFYIKNRFSESLAGRKRIFEMYPLSFEEYLRFTENKFSNLSKFKGKKISEAVFKKLTRSYEQFIKYGGFPEVVLAETNEDRKAYLSDIINSYISLDILLLSDLNASDDLYKLIKLLSSIVGSKIDHSKIGSLISLDRRKVKEYIELLEHTYFIQTISPFTKSKAVEISKAKKLYFSDTGVLNTINSNLQSGAVFENAVFNTLRFQQRQINYYQKKTGQEIDFIIDEKLALEVKETPIASDWSTTKRRAHGIKIKTHKLIGRKLHKSYRNYIWGANI